MWGIYEVMQVVTAAIANGPEAPQLTPVTMLSISVNQWECPSIHVVEDWVGLKTELDWYEGENISRPPAFEPRTVRLVVNRHTDDAVPAADIIMR
jgi:hypothetical protein